MKKIMYHPSILPQHLLSLGPFPFKRLLQNLTELTSQLQAEYRALTCAPGHKRDNLLTWGCLPWPQSLDSGTGKGSATVNKASRIVANRSQSRTSPEQLEWSLHNPFCCITFIAKRKGGKADSWGMPVESSTEYAGVSPGTPHSSLPWDLSLTLCNKDILLTLLR